MVQEIKDEKISTQFKVNGQKVKKYFGQDWIVHVFEVNKVKLKTEN